MLRLFQNSFIFGEATYSHFFRVTTLTQQLLFRSMYFFRAAAFLRSSLFLEQSLFSKQLSFQSSYFSRAKHLPSGHFLRIESSSWQLLFRTATILAVVLFKIKISTEELLFPSRYFCTGLTFSEKLHFGKQLIFQKSKIVHYLLSLESYLSRAASFSKDLYLLLWQLNLQKSFFLQHTVSEKRFLHKLCPCFNIVFAQIRVIPRTRNKFVKVAAVAERYLIVTHIKNKESKKRPFRICLPVILCLSSWKNINKKGRNFFVTS